MHSKKQAHCLNRHIINLGRLIEGSEVEGYDGIEPLTRKMRAGENSRIGKKELLMSIFCTPHPPFILKSRRVILASLTSYNDNCFSGA